MCAAAEAMALCTGCRNSIQLWLGDEVLDKSDYDAEAKRKLHDEVTESTASAEVEADAPPPAGQGAKLVLKHRHRSECHRSEGNRFITNAQL